VSDDSAEDNAEPDPARQRPKVPEVPRKITPAKVAGGGGLLAIGAGILYVVLHWHSITHPDKPVPTFPSIHLPTPSIHIPTTAR
jgi:hypothetical protein